jgi:hypothetical protein
MRRKPKDPNSPRAQAARTNGAKSKGPVTEEGKKNSSQNALKHGLTALKWAGRPEDEAAYQEFSQAVTAELNPQGILQEVLAERIVSAMWRLRKIPQIEASLALSVEESDKWTYNQRVAQWPHQKLALSRYEANIHRCMHKDMKELRALKEEAAQAARQAIFDEREREVREARRLQRLEARNSQFEIRQNEPNQVHNRFEEYGEALTAEEFLAELSVGEPTIYQETPNPATKTTTNGARVSRSARNRSRQGRA